MGGYGGGTWGYHLVGADGQHCPDVETMQIAHSRRPLVQFMETNVIKKAGLDNKTFFEECTTAHILRIIKYSLWSQRAFDNLHHLYAQRSAFGLLESVSGHATLVLLITLRSLARVKSLTAVEQVENQLREFFCAGPHPHGSPGDLVSNRKMQLAAGFAKPPPTDGWKHKLYTDNHPKFNKNNMWEDDIDKAMLEYYSFVNKAVPTVMETIDDNKKVLESLSSGVGALSMSYSVNAYNTMHSPSVTFASNPSASAPPDDEDMFADYDSD